MKLCLLVWAVVATMAVSVLAVAPPAKETLPSVADLIRQLVLCHTSDLG